ncbi:hypothetical protein pEaSNUABM29_00081 [Erwinia phage pEa_SNUABM_29]|nr:hypothetical protein pEaSNUABM29_00081 [Erwinia phage pEa_SNUABM_29]
MKLCYVLEKSKITASMFDGRGFLVSACDNGERRGLTAALMSDVEMYLSRDAVEGILEWANMWQRCIARDEEVKYMPESLNVDGIDFILYSSADYDFTPLHQIHPTQLEALFDTIRTNFTTGFERIRWHQQYNGRPGPAGESHNKPGMMICYGFERDSLVYGYRTTAEPNPAPLATTDLSMVRTADSLLSIANTATYPQAGYLLNLKLGFGEQTLAELNRDQLRAMAERLIP